MRRLISIAAAAGLALAMIQSAAIPTSAATQDRGKVIDRQVFDYEDHFLVEDSCDVPGLTKQVDIVHHGTLVYRARGRDRLPYAEWDFDSDYVFTNVDNAKFVTIDEDYRAHDILVRDNGDGTNSGLSKERIYRVMHDQRGRKLEYESIRTLARWTVDNGGTPQDPADDEEIEWVYFREVGHVADFCAATSPPSPTRNRRRDRGRPTPGGEPSPRAPTARRSHAGSTGRSGRSARIPGRGEPALLPCSAGSHRRPPCARRAPAPAPTAVARTQVGIPAARGTTAEHTVLRTPHPAH